jgi:hypothetical protein
LSRCTDFGLPKATTGESAERVHQAALAEAAKAKGWEERQRLRKRAGHPSRRPRCLLLIQGSRPPLKLRYMSPLALEVCSNSSSASTSGYCLAVSPSKITKKSRSTATLACSILLTFTLPVLQGYSPRSYAAHLGCYGELLTLGQWVGVGSVCKRNGNSDRSKTSSWPSKLSALTSTPWIRHQIPRSPEPHRSQVTLQLR